MTHEVVVIGGGIGGLTVAALLAARGVDVCLLEREAQVGGCVSPFEFMNYSFEPGAGLYAMWGPGEIHERVFAEMPVTGPEVKPVSPAYVVRLPDGSDVPIESADDAFYASLQKFFPECAAAAIKFYGLISQLAQAYRRLLARSLDASSWSKYEWLRVAAADPRLARYLLNPSQSFIDSYLRKTSPHFQKFIDVQLQTWVGQTSAQCPTLLAAFNLMLPRQGLYSIRGGGAALAETLAESIKLSGGRVRTQTTALRLERDPKSGHASGVILLSGEIVHASRAVISNLTVWDTYGKLIGLNQTPLSIRSKLKNMTGWGCYLLFLGMKEEAGIKLPAERLIALLDWEDKINMPANNQFMLNVAPVWDSRETQKTAMTVSTFTDVDEWFAYQETEDDLEALDRAATEYWWEKIHLAIPGLGDSVELIETATPRNFYERTRRKLGMVWGPGPTANLFSNDALTHQSPIPNLYLVGDTVFPGSSVAGVTHSAMIVANKIAPPLK